MDKKQVITTLYLMRHGSTDLNHEHRYQGETDLPLSAYGKREIKQLRKRIKHIPFDLVLTSSAQRSQQTYKLLFTNEEHVLIHKGLTEINFGIWEGLTQSEIQSRYPKELSRYEKDPFTYAPKGGETFAAAFERIKNLHQDIRSIYKGKIIAILGHGGSLNIFLCYLLGIKPQTTWQFQLQPASLVKIVIYPNNRISMEL